MGAEPHCLHPLEVCWTLVEKEYLLPLTPLDDVPQ